MLWAHALDQLRQAGSVHVALEGMHPGRLEGFGDGQVHRLCADELAVGAGGVKVGVVRHHVALLAHHVEQDALCGAALVRGDDVAETEDTLHRVAEARKAGRARIGFVAAHHRRPLLGGHGAEAGIGEQVNQDEFRGNQEQVVAGGFEKRLPLLTGCAGDGLDGLDAKRFNDGFGGHELAPQIASGTPNHIFVAGSKRQGRAQRAARDCAAG